VKAIVMREFGAPEVMRLEEVATPEPGPGEVLIRVKAVSVNRTLDLIVRSGRYATPVQLPHVLGVDPSGVVEALGPSVTERKVGDRVVTMQFLRPPSPTTPPAIIGVHGWGGYAEYVKVPATLTRPIPQGVDFPTATVVARHAPTAFSLLRDTAQLKSGEWILVMGAAGGLASAGIQVAKYYGAKVIAAAGADERVKAALGLGADHGINYNTRDLHAEVMRLTGGNGVNVLYDNIANPKVLPQAFLALGFRGRLVTAGAHGGPNVIINFAHLYHQQITIIGRPGNDPADLPKCFAAAAEGKIRPQIERIMPLKEAAAAHRLMESGEVTGKIVLDPTMGMR
jgi:NADPH:quinone reductase-like Zn-dependent oxidoreductase